MFMESEGLLAKFMKKRCLKIFVLLVLFSLCGCQANPDGIKNLLTPTPPVPVFGNFVMGVATSHPSGLSSPSLEGPRDFNSSSLRTATFHPSFLEVGGIRITETRQVLSQISFKLEKPRVSDQGAADDRADPNDQKDPTDKGDSTDQGDSTGKGDSTTKGEGGDTASATPRQRQTGADNPSEIQFPGTYVIQLIKDGEIVSLEFPDFGAPTIPFGIYHSFEMRFDILESTEIPTALLDDLIVTHILPRHHLVLQGSFTLTANILGATVQREVPIVLISDQSALIRVSSPQGFEVSPGRINYFFIAFRIDDWFNGIASLLQQITDADLTDNTLIVSPEHPNPLVRQILALFEQNLNQACKSAPSLDATFEEADVDESSLSLPL